MRLSLSSEYLIYSLVILASIFIVSVFLYCYSYSLYTQEKNEQLVLVSQHLQQAVERVFEKNKNLAKGSSIDPPSSNSNVKESLRMDETTNEANLEFNKISSSAGINFMVVDEYCHVLFKSTQGSRAFLSPSVCEALSNKEVELLSQSYGGADNDYWYHRRLKNYPNIVIFTNFERAVLEKELHKQLFPRLCELVLMGLFCIVLLYFFRRKIIKPISILSRYALLISKGEVHDKIPKQESPELFNLARALILVKHYIKRNENYRKKLEEANEIVKTSAEAREEFIKNIYHELMHPLKEILICTELLRENVGKERAVQTAFNLKCLDKIQDAIMGIKSKTSNSLNLSYFNFNDIILQAIQINLKQSFSKNITIQTTLAEPIPNMIGDALKLKQVLVCLISEAIDNSSLDEKILISSNTLVKDFNTTIEIIIQDFGFGLSEEELFKIQNNVGWMEETSTFMNMEHPFIEKVIKMHNGQFNIENKMHQGRTVSLTFPLLDEIDYKKAKEITETKRFQESNVYFLNPKDTLS